MDLTPGSPEWAKLVTASKVAAILGVSRWDSPRSMWHKMHGDLPAESEGTTVQKRGHYLEPAILAWWRDQHPEHAEYRDQPFYRLGDWAAATPDATALLGTEGEADWHRVIVDAKSVADDSEWGDPGTDAIPSDYLSQVFWQMHVSGVHRCYVPIITSRLRFAEYVVDYDAEIGTDLERRMRAFYDTLAADEPPPLDDTVATYDAIRKVHPEIDRGESVEVANEVAWMLAHSNAEKKAAEDVARYWRSFALDQMGRAQYLTNDGVRVARRQPDGPERTKFVIVAKPSDLTKKEAVA